MNLTIENIHKVAFLDKNALQNLDLNSSKASNASTVIIPENTVIQQEKIFKDSTPIQLEKKIGQGTFGTVYLSHKKDGSKVAIKQIIEDDKYYNREISIFKLISLYNHPNIVRILGIFYINETPFKTTNIMTY